MIFLSNLIHIYYNVYVFEDSSVNEDEFQLQTYKPRPVSFVQIRI
jgi:hypothetical protein